MHERVDRPQVQPVGKITGSRDTDLADPVRELTSYLLSRPGTSPETLFGGLVNHEPHRIAQLRGLLRADLALLERGLATLDDLDAAGRSER